MVIDGHLRYLGALQSLSRQESLEGEESQEGKKCEETEGRQAIQEAADEDERDAATAGSATLTSAVLPDLNMGTSTLSLPSSAPAHSSSSLNTPTEAGAGADPQEDAAVQDVEMEHASQEPPPDPQQFLQSLRPSLPQPPQPQPGKSATLKQRNKGGNSQ
jgi:hypothetical protein